MSRVLVLGASGFLGSHLCDELLNRGDEVVGIDDLSSSSGKNLEQLESNSGFTFIKGDIADGIPKIGQVDAVLNFASPASPPRYLATPIQTLRTGSLGTENALRFALENNARFIMASTSEIYGDPTVSPQVESYWGNVNSIGERSCYDEAKRYAEALCMAYWREHDANIGIIRIFNTYGPRLDPMDGRVVSNFVCQSIQGHDLTVYGDGSQTRSFCYVDDEIRGILAMLDSNERGPINIGNPVEFTMLELADLVLELTSSKSQVVYKPLPSDDPLQRCPDITQAQNLLNWSPTIDLREGLGRTIDWFQSSLQF
jgi:nucleoside-diphosphate-sugar epimerase